MIPLMEPDGLHEAVEAERRRRVQALHGRGCTICGLDVRRRPRTVQEVTEPPEGGRPCDECWRELGAGG